MRDGFKADAEVGGQLAAVVDGARGGIGAGHADADHIFRAERFGGDGRHQGGVDAAAEADDDLAEAAFAHVVARAQHQRAVGGLGVVVFGNRHRRRIERIDDDQVLCETMRPARSARRAHSSASEEPSKIRLSLPPTWLHISTGMRVAAGDGGQHLAADGALGVPERRRREIDVQRRVLAHQLFHGIDGVEAARPEVLVVPGVLADGDGEANAVELDHLLRAGRRKVALLVEDVVKGQEALVLFEKQIGRGRGGRRR